MTTESCNMIVREHILVNNLIFLYQIVEQRLLFPKEISYLSFWLFIFNLTTSPDQQTTIVTSLGKFVRGWE